MRKILWSVEEAVHKRRPQSGARGLSSADKGEEVIQMRTSALFGASNFRFFEMYGVSAGTEES